MSTDSDISTISILGCGWLGSALAWNLLTEGYKVKGSTRHAEKKSVMKDVGIKPYLLTLTPELSQLNPDDFFKTDLLILTLSPGKEEKGSDFYSGQIRAIAEEVRRHAIKKVIYISSASVYPDLEKEISENDAPEPENTPEPAIREAEEILKNISGTELTILRCGELMGYERIPGRHLTGKKELNTGDLPVNYIHRDDVTGVVSEILKQNYWNQTLNVVAPQHPTCREVYLQNAADFKFEPPSFTGSSSGAKKIISPKKLQEDLQYTFFYPDPLKFRYK